MNRIRPRTPNSHLAIDNLEPLLHRLRLLGRALPAAGAPLRGRRRIRRRDRGRRARRLCAGVLEMAFACTNKLVSALCVLKNRRDVVD